MQNILGISLGSRLLGIAVLYDGTLLDFRVRTFYGKWDEKKQADIIATIEKVIVQYRITTVVLKTPKATHCSQSIQNLLDDVRLLSKQMGIKLRVCTVSCLKERYSGNKRANKQVIVQDIIRKYPQHKQLTKIHSKERSNRSAYHIKVFEAIACAEMELRTEH